MSGYHEEEYLQLSGIQHFAFCRRQWALIHLEQQWADNLRTVEGELMHQNAHDRQFSERRGELLVARGMAVYSARLGVTGACDVVEFHQSQDGVALIGRRDKWLPVPVEYKRGTSKMTDADRLQLCCQAICLEEMLACEISTGYLYYGQTHRREQVDFVPKLRQTVEEMLCEMHQYTQRQYTPKVKPHRGCRACSLKDVCLPELCGDLSATDYLRAHAQEGPV